ncbi:MAG TPA: ferredoxin [Acidimicrobiales bacterium]|nr:ferredoxin [Acidimicrobiales bacterium]
MRLVIDEVLCAGHAICEEVAPDLFELGSDGIASVRVEVVPIEALERARLAILRCPAEAIRLES